MLRLFVCFLDFCGATSGVDACSYTTMMSDAIVPNTSQFGWTIFRGSRQDGCDRDSVSMGGLWYESSLATTTDNEGQSAVETMACRLC